MNRRRIGLFLIVCALFFVSACSKSGGTAGSGTSGETEMTTEAGRNAGAEPGTAGQTGSEGKTGTAKIPGTVEVRTEEAEPGAAGRPSTQAEPGAESKPGTVTAPGVAGKPGAEAEPGPAAGSVPGLSEESVTDRFEILEVKESGLLVAGLGRSKGLYHVGHGTVLKDTDGTELSVSDLKETEIVELTWNGMINETYPGQFGYDALKKTGETGSSTFVFYRQLLKDLAETDSGLNSGINQSFFDFNGIASLSGEEKEGLAYLAGSDYGVIGSQSTAEELKEQGILDREKGIEAGILVTVEELTHKDGRVTCSANKYRSGTGAYYFEDVTAEYKNGKWEYKIGTHMIS